MARTRYIKPGFFQNEELGELPPMVRLFFIGLWTLADYRGVVEWRPIRIKIQLAPYDKGDVNKWLKMLVDFRFVTKFEVNGKSYIKICNFEFHQHPHKSEIAAGTKLPDITDSTTYESKTPIKSDAVPEKSEAVRPYTLNLNTSNLDVDTEPHPKPDAARTRTPKPTAPTDIEAADGRNLGWQFKMLFDAFPDLTLTPAHVGLISSAVKDGHTDRAAWKATINLYVGNQDPTKPQSYNPGRIGTVLSVFEKEKERLKNGTGKPNGKRTDADVFAESKDFYANYDEQPIA